MKAWIICGVFSFVINIFFLCYAIKLYHSETRTKRILSSVQIYTTGLFLAVLVLFIPIYYKVYPFGDKYKYLRPLLLSIHSAFRTFILDGDFEIIRNSLKAQPKTLRVLYALYCAVLYVVAPVMTFTNVLSLFKNIKGEIRYWYHRLKKIYVFSELNPKAVALAKSIRKTDKKSVIVFTDVFEQNEEDDYELLMQARDIKAICLKRDVSHLNIAGKKGDVEIFLIGENEAENVSQAVKITNELNRLNKKSNVKVFVFSRQESGAYILDSVRYENLLNSAAKNKYGDKTFKLRRINEIRQLAWKTVAGMKIFETAQKNNNSISILIAGMGSYGMEFFKTLVWFCQFEGFELKITILDKMTDGFDGKKSVESVINHRCPELLMHNMDPVDGEAKYSIKILSGVDLETASFEEMVFYSGEDVDKIELAKRIKETDIAIVSLGDDDLNIETAVRFRSIFDRIYGLKAVKTLPADEEPIQIYSIVYDEQKSGILHCDDNIRKTAYLINHADVPYHIHFIGGMSSQFDYSNVYDADFEEKAYEHHLDWVRVLSSIYREQNRENDAIVLEKEYSDPVKLEEEKKKYERHEYYRQSSMAKEMYRRAVGTTLASLITCTEKKNGIMLQTCTCENCVRRKKSEHMRWNAYMRTIGYSYKDGIRADRAKLHNNLVGWENLSDFDKLKD